MDKIRKAIHEDKERTDESGKVSDILVIAHTDVGRRNPDGVI